MPGPCSGIKLRTKKKRKEKLRKKSKIYDIKILATVLSHVFLLLFRINNLPRVILSVYPGGNNMVRPLSTLVVWKF